MRRERWCANGCLETIAAAPAIRRSSTRCAMCSQVATRHAREVTHMNAPQRFPPQLHSITDDPRFIGASVPRAGARRLAEGRGTYVDDIKLPRMAHVVYWRS